MTSRVLYAVFALCLLSGCSINLSDSGSGSEAGNTKIIGTIVDESGKPVDSALVTLAEKTDSIFIYRSNTGVPVYDTSVTTDSTGRFAFNLPRSGMYQITVEKNNRFLVFIDSIAVIDTTTIQLPTAMVKAPGVVTGRVFLEDSAGISNKQIRIICAEKKDYAVTISHGENFLFSDMPQGRYTFYCLPESDIFVAKRLKTNVTSGDTSDLDDILLQKGANYLLSSNVMTGDFIGHENVPINKTPEYAFTVTPQKIALVKVVEYPEDVAITVDAVINGNNVVLNHESDFPRGTEIGVYLSVMLSTGEKVSIDFITDPKHHFKTQDLLGK